MIEKISIGEALSLDSRIFIDVRTPLEFSDGAIPKAVNIPILSNDERIEIGTLYKQRGAVVARGRGLEVVSPKLPEFFKAIKKVSEGKIPLLYCWRGGLRSETAAAVCGLTGLPVKVIEGGYKSYRREVLSILNGDYPFELIPLYGLTGSGKTLLLQKMKEEGFPVIDLEALAKHRGSVFGHVGFSEKQTQKNFEALLCEEIRKYQREKFVFVEGESQRIGSVLLPESWMRQMMKGRKMFIKSSLQRRSQRILEEYLPHVEQLEEALISLKKRLGGGLFCEIYNLFRQREYESVVRLLLERYYDRNYKFSAKMREGNEVRMFVNDTGEDQRKILNEMKSASHLTDSFESR
jgi:tRNA 2-selenouridine synthase